LNLPRLILSHLGFLSIPALRAAMDSPVPRLVALLETDSPSFSTDLEQLDRLSPRTFDTLLAYYVRAGQTAPQDILANSRAGDLSPLYLECLAALGNLFCLLYNVKSRLLHHFFFGFLHQGFFHK
jgi:hypothetical protein